MFEENWSLKEVYNSRISESLRRDWSYNKEDPGGVVSLDLRMSSLSIGRGSTLEGENKALEFAYFSGALAEHGWKTKSIRVLDVRDQCGVSVEDMGSE